MNWNTYNLKSLQDVCKWYAYDAQNHVVRHNATCYDITFALNIEGHNIEIISGFDVLNSKSIEGNRMFFLLDWHGMSVN